MTVRHVLERYYRICNGVEGLGTVLRIQQCSGRTVGNISEAITAVQSLEQWRRLSTTVSEIKILMNQTEKRLGVDLLL